MQSLEGTSILAAALWLLLLAATGVCTLALPGGRRPRSLPPALYLPVGMAVVIPLAMAASPLINTTIACWLVAGLGAVSLSLWWCKARRRDLRVFRLSWSEGLCALLAIAAGVAVLNKPMLNYDVLSYHLPLAHWVAEHGCWDYRPGDFYSRLPQAASVLYAPLRAPWADASWGGGGVRLLHLVVFANCAALCARIAGQCGARALGRAASGLLFLGAAMPWASLVNGHSDLLTALLGLAATERLLARGGRNAPDLFLAALLAGTAAAVKFSALGIVCIPLVISAFALVIPARRITPKGKAIRLALLATGLAVSLGPWAIRSTVLGGHPLHPFRGEAPGWTAEQADFVVDEHGPRDILDAAYWRTAPDALFDVISVSLIIRPSDERGERPPWSINILLVPIVLGLVLGRRRLPIVALLLMAVAAGLAWNLAAGNPARFLLPALGWLATAAGVSIGRLRRVRVAMLLGAGICGLAVLLSWISPAGAVRPLLTAIWAPRAAWLQQTPLPVTYVSEVGRVVGDGKVLLLFDAQSRAYPQNQVMNTVWDRPPWADALPEDRPLQEDDFVRAFASTGASWIAVNEFELGRLVDFYGNVDGEPMRGRVGTGSGTEELGEAIAAWPPARWGGFDDSASANALARTLTGLRVRARLAVPMGPQAETWLAPLESPTRE